MPSNFLANAFEIEVPAAVISAFVFLENPQVPILLRLTEKQRSKCIADYRRFEEKSF